MALYYCSRGDITDLLPTLTGSDISTTAQQDSKLRAPARAWIDSVYPGDAPFASISANEAIDWQVNQSDHQAADATVTVDGGSGDPAVGDLFRVVGENQWDTDLENTQGRVDDSQEYRVTAYSAGVITHEPTAQIQFVDNAPLHFGTPLLIRRAATLYALHLAFQILRDNILDQEAGEALSMAKAILQIPENKHLAKARPESTSNKARSTMRVMRST